MAKKRKKRNKGTVWGSILSYGGGVQSFAILLAIRDGLIPRPDVVAHVDMSPYEPATRQHIATIARPLAKDMRLEWVTLDGSELRRKLYEGITMTPYWHDKGLHAQRLCTIRYKIDNVDNLIAPRAWCAVQVGISTDELRRATHEFNILSRGRVKEKVYPLLDLKWSRDDCMAYIQKCGYAVPPKSACYICPFSSEVRILRNLIEIPEMYVEIKAIEARWHVRGNYERYLTVFRDKLPTPAEALVMLQQMGEDVFDNSGACGVCEF